MRKITLALLSACITSMAATTYAQMQDGHWLVRVRAIDVIPYANSNIINTIGGRVNTISTEVVPELDISYFFTPAISAELILATARHHVYANNTALGRVALGHVNILPPTLTLQYHFLPDKIINPYVGAGINYTYFYYASPGNVATSINYSNSFGPALQAGLDVLLDKNWSLNIDVKKVFVESIVNANTPAGNLNPDVKLNPLIIGIGAGYRFG